MKSLLQSPKSGTLKNTSTASPHWHFCLSAQQRIDFLIIMALFISEVPFVMGHYDAFDVILNERDVRHPSYPSDKS